MAFTEAMTSFKREATVCREEREAHLWRSQNRGNYRGANDQLQCLAREQKGCMAHPRQLKHTAQQQHATSCGLACVCVLIHTLPISASSPAGAPVGGPGASRPSFTASDILPCSCRTCCCCCWSSCRRCSNRCRSCSRSSSVRRPGLPTAAIPLTEFQLKGHCI